jgi:hypothetical protein
MGPTVCACKKTVARLQEMFSGAEGVKELEYLAAVLLSICACMGVVLRGYFGTVIAHIGNHVECQSGTFSYLEEIKESCGQRASASKFRVFPK